MRDLRAEPVDAAAFCRGARAATRRQRYARRIDREEEHASDRLRRLAEASPSA
jgi:hypothetical protein